MPKKPEPILKHMRNQLDKYGYQDVEVKFKDSDTDIFSVGKTVVDNKYSVVIGGKLLQYNTDEIKDTLLQPIILLNIQSKDKCTDGFSSKHWKKWAKKLGYLSLRTPDIKQPPEPKRTRAEIAPKPTEEPIAKETSEKPIKHEQASSTGESDSVICKLKTQTAEFSMEEYRIVQFTTKTIKVYKSNNGDEVKAMGFLKAVNAQYDLGFNVDNTNTRSLGSRIIKALNKINLKD